MKTLATLATAGSYSTLGPGQVLVGRTVANAQFLKALARHGSFEELVLFIGENQDQAEIERFAARLEPQAQRRIRTRHLVELPQALAAGELDVVHHNTPTDKLFDLFWLRDRYARRTLPVTGQIHSLSYPRMVREYLATRWLRPGACDGLFCSTSMGKQAVEACFQGLPEAEPLPWELPVVPLGVDLDQVQGGDRLATRKKLSIPDDAFVVLSMARFSEYDKMDLFPLLQAFRTLVKTPGPSQPYFLLAGARQGTKTPEMLSLWAKALGFEDRLRWMIDFHDEDKRHALAAADVFVSPCDNVQETFGQTVVEAMAAGLPLVVSDFDGYKDTVDAEVGVRVPSRLNVDWSELSDLAPLLYERPLHLWLGQSIEVDVRALTEALLELRAHPQRCRQLGERGRTRAKHRFSWSKVIPQYEEVWRRLASKPHSPSAFRRHPLRLDFGQVFGHYPTGLGDPSRKVARSALSRELDRPGKGLQYVVYPELKPLFNVGQVAALLSRAESPVEVEFLVEQAASLLGDKPRWTAQLLVGWMLKHGLLE